MTEAAPAADLIPLLILVALIGTAILQTIAALVFNERLAALNRKLHRIESYARRQTHILEAQFGVPEAVYDGEHERG